MIVYALIPARSGSKGVPNKNIKLLHGHPLLAWSVTAAVNSRNISRTFISTDSPDYAQVARDYGAEAPFLRPSEYAQDHSRDFELLVHALDSWAERNIPIPDFIVFLRPTTPLREPMVIDAIIDAMASTEKASSLCTGFELAESPAKNFSLGDDGMFHGFMGDSYLLLPRQECPKAYVWDGYVDMLRPGQIRRGAEHIYGDKRMAYITKPGVEIDTQEEFDFIDFLLAKKGHPLLELLSKRRGNGH